MMIKDTAYRRFTRGVNTKAFFAFFSLSTLPRINPPAISRMIMKAIAKKSLGPIPCSAICAGEKRAPSTKATVRRTVILIPGSIALRRFLRSVRK